VTTKKTTLPSFKNPPLTEVVLSVQFETLSKLQSPQMGLLWGKFRSKYPVTEQHPEVDGVVEQFGDDVGSPIHVEVSKVTPTPRIWFLSEESPELIQVQQNRFIHNWRKTGPEDTYPRYEHIRKEFEQDLDIFLDFLKEEKIGDFQPNQCEISYINHIEANEIWKDHSEFEKINPFWKFINTDGTLEPPENIKITTQHIFNDGEGKPQGRLYIAHQPVFLKKDKKPVYAMSLVVRGRPLTNDIDGIFSFFDHGRKLIVQSFAAVTTAELHKLWGREDE